MSRLRLVRVTQNGFSIHDIFLNISSLETFLLKLQDFWFVWGFVSDEFAAETQTYVARFSFGSFLFA